MSNAQRQMSIGMNILGFGAHAAAWRTGEAPPTAYLDVGYYQNIARISERGTLDAIFLADGPALTGDVGRQPAGRLEPTVLLTAVALATQRIGVISTASSSYNEPFNLARRIASAFAQPQWPSTRRRKTGRPGAIASRTAEVGNAPPGQRLWSQLAPRTHPSPGVASILALTRRATSSGLPAPRRSTTS